MREIGAFEAKNTFGTLLDRVERGEEILITRHGKPVGRLVASTGHIDRKAAHAASARIRERTEQLAPEQFDWTMLKSERDHGRL